MGRKLLYDGMLALGLLVFSGSAWAYDWAVSGAKVVVLEASYMPSAALILIDKAAGSCTAGTFLAWNAQGVDAATKANNANAVYALLLSAKSTGQTVTLYGNNAGCLLVNVWAQ